MAPLAQSIRHVGGVSSFGYSGTIVHAALDSVRGRNGIYDVTVINQDNKKIAEFRGMSRAINGNLFQE